MSSLPGYYLEDFLAWELNLVVDGQEDANVSIGMAEALGNIPSRPRVTQERFREIVKLFESSRKYIEDRLRDFDEENQSWRDYAGCAFDDIPEILYTEAKKIVSRLKDPAPVDSPENLKIKELIIEALMREYGPLTAFEVTALDLTPQDALQGWSWTLQIKRK